MFRQDSLERREAPSVSRHERFATGSITATSLRFADRTIRAVARREGPRDSLATLCLRSACRELMLRVGRRVNFRQAENQAACRAYDAMRIDDFRDINALQAWANWRTIPRNLSGELPNRPILAIDLCSGTGDSTAVLAYYCAPGSQILGLEFNPNFVTYARGRRYVDRRRRPADVAFTVQSVLEPFRAPHGLPLADASADLVNAAGAVGCHFDRAATRTLARECGRVVKPGGLAMIDAGRGGAEVRDLLSAFTAEGFTAVRQSRSCLFDLGRQVCLRKTPADD